MRNITDVRWRRKIVNDYEDIAGKFLPVLIVKYRQLIQQYILMQSD